MSKIVWIASYPKSGNTWVRFLAANLLYGTITESAMLERIIPDIHKGLKGSDLISDGLKLIKTHWQFKDELPLREDTVGAIYIVRHPIQVVASLMNYVILGLGSDYYESAPEEQARIRNNIINNIINNAGLPDYQSLGMGNIIENVGSWFGEDKPYPILYARYEDLKKDPVAFTARMNTFFQQEKTAAEIEAAVQASSFESLRKMEEKELSEGQEGFFTSEIPQASHAHDGHFINQGKADGYRDILSPRQIDAAAACFKPIMDQLDYAP